MCGGKRVWDPNCDVYTKGFSLLPLYKLFGSSSFAIKQFPRHTSLFESLCSGIPTLNYSECVTGAPLTHLLLASLLLDPRQSQFVCSRVRMVSRMTKLLVLPFCSLLAVIFTLFVALLLALTLPYRLIVKCLALLTRPDLVSFVTGISAVFTLDSVTEPSLNIMSYLTIDKERFELAEMQALFQRNVLDKRRADGSWVYQRFRYTYTTFMGYTFWKTDPDFHVSHHVRSYDHGEYNKELMFPSPFNEEDLRERMGGILADPWRNGHSPWELLWLFNYVPEHPSLKSDKPYTILLFRAHHGLGDGHSLSQLNQDFGITYQTSAVVTKVRKPLWMQVVVPMILPFKMAWDSAANLLDSCDWNTPWKPRGIPLTKTFHTSFTQPIPVDLIKEIKNKYRVSYMAVMYTAIGGGISRVMREVGQKVPESMGCFIPIPKPNHPGPMTNHMRWIQTVIPIGDQPATSRLKHAQDHLNSLKYSTAPLGIDFYIYFYGLMPRFLTRHVKFLINSALMGSNFPVPPEAVTFQGYRVPDYILGCGTAEVHCGANVMMLGTQNKQRIVFNIDKAVFPSKDVFKKIGAYVEEEFQTMRGQSPGRKRSKVILSIPSIK